MTADDLRVLAIRAHQHFTGYISASDIRRIRAMSPDKLCPFVSATLRKYEHVLWAHITEWEESGKDKPSSKVTFAADILNVPLPIYKAGGRDPRSTEWAANKIRRQEFVEALLEQYKKWLGPKGLLGRLGSGLKSAWTLWTTDFQRDA